MKHTHDIPATPITYDELFQLVADGKIAVHHSALFRGYVSRKMDIADIRAYPYSGRYGVGYTVDFPNYNSTWYSYRSYFIFTDQGV